MHLRLRRRLLNLTTTLDSEWSLGNGASFHRTLLGVSSRGAESTNGDVGYHQVAVPHRYDDRMTTGGDHKDSCRASILVRWQIRFSIHLRSQSSRLPQTLATPRVRQTRQCIAPITLARICYSWRSQSRSLRILYNNTSASAPGTGAARRCVLRHSAVKTY